MRSEDKQSHITARAAVPQNEPPRKRENRIFSRACAPLLAAALTVGAGITAGCGDKETQEPKPFVLPEIPNFTAFPAPKPDLGSFASAVAEYRISDAKEKAKELGYTPDQEREAVLQVLESLIAKTEYDRVTQIALSYSITERQIKEAAYKAMNSLAASGDILTPNDIAEQYGVDRIPPTSALAFGIMDNDLGEVKRAIANGANVNVHLLRDISIGETPLMMASELGNPKIVNLLLKSGADPNAADSRGDTALIRAMENKQDNVVKMLLPRMLDTTTDINKLIPDKISVEDQVSVVCEGGSLLKIAVQIGDFSLVKKLIERGANLEARYNGGATPFLTAAETGRTEVLQYLYANHANWRAQVNGKNALMLAIANQRKKAVDFLLKITPNEELDGVSVLREAARIGDVNLAKKLVSRGADFRETEWLFLTKDGVETPLMAAAGSGKPKMVEYLLKIPPISLLSAKDAKDKDGKTALMFAAIKGDEKCVRILLDAGVDKNARDKENRTALSQAEQMKNTRVYNLLISEGVIY